MSIRRCRHCGESVMRGLFIPVWKHTEEHFAWMGIRLGERMPESKRKYLEAKFGGHEPDPSPEGTVTVWDEEECGRDSSGGIVAC